MVENRYKVITVPSQTKTTSDLERLLFPLFKKYNKNDIYYVANDSHVEVYLRSLDVEKFRSDMVKVLDDTGKSVHLAGVLREIVEKIEAIKSYGVRSGKRIYVDYNAERKVNDRASKARQRLAGDQKEKTTSATAQLPSFYENKIICGDSLLVLKALPDNCIDLIFTSPPYNFGMSYEATDDAHRWNGYFDQLFKIFDEGIRVLKPGGRFIVNIQPLFSDYVPSHHIISNYFLGKNMLWKGEIVWEKNNYNCKYTSWGSWKSPSSPYLKYTWEFVEVFAKGSLKKEGSPDNADITADEFKKWVVAKWSIAPERKMKEFGHPAMFPEELAERALKLFSFKNDFVLDPFNGAGTTTAVAKRLGRRYLGIDISEEYCKRARERMARTLF